MNELYCSTPEYNTLFIRTICIRFLLSLKFRTIEPQVQIDGFCFVSAYISQRHDLFSSLKNKRDCFLKGPLPPFNLKGQCSCLLFLQTVQYSRLLMVSLVVKLPLFDHGKAKFRKIRDMVPL